MTAEHYALLSTAISFGVLLFLLSVLFPTDYR